MGKDNPNFFHSHEFQAVCDVIHGKDYKNMHEHEAKAVCFLLAVNNVVIKQTVAEKKANDNQKCHQGKIGSPDREAPLKVGRDADDHFPKGKDDV